MTIPARPPYRISYPLNAEQVENVDTMFETLFRTVRNFSDHVTTTLSGGSSGLDAGAIIFSTGTALTGDAAHLFWDSTNNRLGIGTSTPKQILHVLTPLGDLLWGANGPNVSCNAYYNAGWKYLANGFAGVVSWQDTATGDFVVYTAASGVADAAITLLDKFHVFQNGAVTVTNGLTADTVTGTTSITAPLTIGTTSLRVGADSTSLFRDTSIEATGIAVRDSGNTGYRALRVSNFGLGDGGSIVTVSRGQITNIGDGQWRLQNNANTSQFVIQPNAFYLSHEAGNNAVVANGSSIFYLGNEAVTTGGNIDNSTADTFKFRNIAKSDEADVVCRNLSAKSVRGNAVTFANRPTPVEGMLVAFTDSTTATWGAVITGTGANHVLGYYNGTNWTVAAI